MDFYELLKGDILMSEIYELDFLTLICNRKYFLVALVQIKFVIAIQSMKDFTIAIICFTLFLFIKLYRFLYFLLSLLY
jgi:hypothetical protein